MATAEGSASAADITEENGLDSAGNTLEYGAENGVEGGLEGGVEGGVEGRYWCEIDPLPSSSAEDEAGPERINYKPRSRIKVLHASSSRQPQHSGVWS